MVFLSEKYDSIIMNIRLNRLDTRQRLAIVDAKCNRANKNVIWLPFVSMRSDKEAGWPMHPSTYMVTHITRAPQLGRRSHRLPRVRAKPRGLLAFSLICNDDSS